MASAKQLLLGWHRLHKTHTWLRTAWRWGLPALVLALVLGQLWWPHQAAAQNPNFPQRSTPRTAPGVPAQNGQIVPAGFIPGRDGIAPPVAQRGQPRVAEAAPGIGPQNLMPSLNAEQLVSPQGLSSTLNLFLLLTVLTLAPSILMMTTCFVRFVIVFGLLRQALGTQTLPPNQVIIGLSLFLTLTVMSPVWQESYEQGIRPYTSPAAGDVPISLTEMFERTTQPIRRFMSEQIDRTNNADTVWMFVEYQRPAPGTAAAATWREPETYDDVSLTALLPAYLISEMKTAFVIGFQIFLPFLIIDMVVASVLVTMGMMMLPPAQISLPFKLLLFVLIDGWTLTVGMLIDSVRTVT